MVTVERATLEDLNIITPLFDAYRVFYKKSSDHLKAKAFLKDRLQNNESIIFIAFFNKKPAGFTQLYPIFSSVSMQAFYILNDLYVSREMRNKGIGESLLTYAKKFSIDKGAKGLALETAKDNPAQKLYEKLNWVRDDDFLHYFWSNASL